MKTLNQYFDEQMRNKDFRQEYEAIQPEMDIIRALVEARTSEGLDMTLRLEFIPKAQTKRV